MPRETPGIEMDRRMLMALFGAGGAGLFAASAAGGEDIPAMPADEAITLYARLVADLSGQPLVCYMSGAVWGFKPQADDLALKDFARRLYGYKTLSVRKARRLPGGDIAIKQQAWTFYCDPVTDAITRTLNNPYTGKTVTPYSPPAPPREVAYRPDGTSYMPSEQKDPIKRGETATFAHPFDMRVKTIGTRSFINTSSFQRIQPGNINWWKLEGTLMSFACTAADLADPTRSHVPNSWSMNLIAEWQTWMNMHGEPGHILFKGDGTSLDSPDQAPADYRTALASDYPGQLERALAW